MAIINLNKSLIDDVPNLRKNLGKANQNAKSHNSNFLNILKKEEEGVVKAAAVFNTTPTQQEIDDLYSILNATATVDISLAGNVLSVQNAGVEATIEAVIYRIDVLWFTLIKWHKKKVTARDIEYFGVKDTVSISLTAGSGSTNISTLTNARDEVLFVKIQNSNFPYNSGEFRKKNNRTPEEKESMVKSIFRNIPYP